MVPLEQARLPLGALSRAFAASLRLQSLPRVSIALRHGIILITALALAAHHQTAETVLALSAIETNDVPSVVLG